MDKKITVYTSESCPYCTMVMEYLKERKVPFTEINLNKQPDKIDYLLEVTGQFGVPQTEIDGEWILGFDPEALSELLDG